MDKEALFNQCWNTMLRNNGGFSGLNEKDKNNIKEMLRGLYNNSGSEINSKELASGVAKEVGSSVSGQFDKLSQALEKLSNKIDNIKTVSGHSSEISSVLEDTPELMADFFKSDMETNIDDIQVDSDSQDGINASVEALRKLKEGG